MVSRGIDGDGGIGGDDVTGALGDWSNDVAGLEDAQSAGGPTGAEGEARVWASDQAAHSATPQSTQWAHLSAGEQCVCSRHLSCPSQ